MKALFALPFVAVLASCSSASPEATAHTDEDLSAKKPIPYVLQYGGDYESGEGAGHVDYLLLKRDGRWVGSIDGRTKTGVYYGPNAPPASLPLKLAFVTKGLSFTADIGAWAPYQTMTVHYAGTTQTLTASWKNGSEDICDGSHGSWTDDDADPATGLFCVCPAHEVYIPSLGGCVR
jgi:hypothetical protein